MGLLVNGNKRISNASFEKKRGCRGLRLSAVRAQNGVWWGTRVPPKPSEQAPLGALRGGEREGEAAAPGLSPARRWREEMARPHRPPGGGARLMEIGLGRQAAGVAGRSGLRQVGEDSRPPAWAWQRSRRAAPCAEPLVPVPCLPRSSWTTRPPCGGTATRGVAVAARSWASSVCWWAMEPWARQVWSSATPPTGTPTSTSPQLSTPSPVGTVPRPGG